MWNPDDESFVLFTLENPWRDNRKWASCIPKGRYVCKRKNSPRFGETFEVMNVPGRTHIVFHWGNWERDTLGCILVGRATDYKKMITHSRLAFGDFMGHLENVGEFELEIR